MPDKETAHKILYNLAAMPVEGLAKDLFVDLSFSIEEQNNGYLIMLERLCRNYWVTEEKRGKEDRLMLHPMVRLIVTKKIDYQEGYLTFLLKKLSNSTVNISAYNDRFPEFLDFTLSLNMLLKERRICDKNDLVLLSAGIISLCDIISDSNKVEELADTTYEGLNNINLAKEEDKVLYANAMNVVGYALLHTENIEENLEKATRLLDKAEKLLDGNEDEESKTVLSKIKGNKAAYYMKIQDWQTMYETHEANYFFRQTLKGSNKDELCGASLRGMATAMYYQAKEAEENGHIGTAAEKFLNSYKTHKAAYKYFHSAQLELEQAITVIRRSGTFLNWLKCLDEKKKHQSNVQDVFIKELGDLEGVLDYLSVRMKKRDEKETANCKDTISSFIDTGIRLNYPLPKYIKEKAGWTANPFTCPDSSLSTEERRRLILDRFNNWLSKEELADLFKESSFKYDAKSEFDKKISFFKHESFNSLWDYRKEKETGEIKERGQIRKEKDKEIPLEIKTKAFIAAQALNLIGVQDSQFENVDYILPLGGGGISNLKRCELANREFVRLKRKPEVVALSTSRLIDFDRADTDTFAPNAQTEFDAISEGMKKAFGARKHEEELSEHDAKIIRLETDNKEDRLFVTSCPSSDPNRRADTNDNYRYFFSQFKVNKGAKIICCTGQVYCTYQQAVALKYACKYNVEIDTIGFSSSKKALAIDYLMEIKKTILAIIDFVDEINVYAKNLP